MMGSVLNSIFFIFQVLWITFFSTGALAQCGVNKISKRIIGGFETTKHEFPWQAAIRWRVGITKGKHVCGGTLINPKYVVTAAHCFAHGKSSLYYDVTLGDHEAGSSSLREQIRNIKQIKIHPNYNEITYDNDIALIELVVPAVLNQYVNTICLPSFIDFEFPGMSCTLSGWGGTHHDKTKSSKVLNKVEVPIVNYHVCNHERSYKGKLTGNMFCAGFANGSADSCQGDSGGPLQCKSRHKDIWLLNGITSWGKGCGTQHKYGVYVVVRHYLTWIQKSMTSVVIPPIPKSTTKPLIPPVSKTTTKPLIPPVPKTTKKPLIPPVPKTTKKPLIPPVPKTTKPLIPPVPKTTKPLIPPVPKTTKALIPPVPKTTKALIPPVPKTTTKPLIPPVPTTVKIPPTGGIFTVVRTRKTSTVIAKTPSIKLPPIPTRYYHSHKIASVTTQGFIIPSTNTPVKTKPILHSKDGKPFTCNRVAKTKTLLFLLCKRKVGKNNQIIEG